MTIEFRKVEPRLDRAQLVDFLTTADWPFHGRRLMTTDDVAAMDFVTPDVDSIWIVDDGHDVGLIRLLELSDIGQGSPQFDLRISAQHRGKGYGTRATQWIVAHLFNSYPELHRIEANTRDDNVAMQRALESTGFLCEGRLRSSWWSENGTWFDTMVYGLLRSDERA